MLSEIGSNFWINPNDGKSGRTLGTPYSSFGYKGSDYVWMSTGRSATRLVLQTIEERNPNVRKVVLIPPFTCYTVIDPFVDFGYEIHTLPLSLNLKTTPEEILQSVEQTGAGVLLVHRYYGFDTLPGFNDIVDLLRSKGVVIIEDSTQCLYSGFELSDADFFVGSIRKWCGVPDGGFAVCRDGRFEHKPCCSDEKMIEAKRSASELKYQFLFEAKGDKPTFKAQYRFAEDLLDNQEGNYSIGELSARMQAELDVDGLKQKRKDNYNVLLNGLHYITGLSIIFSVLPDDVTPLYFPILVDNRVQWQDLLADNDIYAPVVWPKADHCPDIDDNSQMIYDKILCIPIDQRYGIDDMDRIVKVINKR